LMGKIFAVEISSRAMREFIERVVRNRPNVFPIFGDARHPLRYGDLVGEVEAVYCDVAQPDQTWIAMENSSMFLKDRGILLLAIKARSIDVTRKPRDIYKEEEEKLMVRGFEVMGIMDLEPYVKDHEMLMVRKPRNPMTVSSS
jgi:fibrillarin-like pre-rRNA processing protein